MKTFLRAALLALLGAHGEPNGLMPIWAALLWFVALLALAFALCQVPRLVGNAIGRKSRHPSNIHR